jgi:hypothetical protein
VLHCQRITVAQEHPPDLGELTARAINVPPNVIVGPYTEALLSVHATETATVVRATHGHLQQNRVGFVRGSKDSAFVVHRMTLAPSNRHMPIRANRGSPALN